MLPDLTDLFIADAYSGMLHTSNTPVTTNSLPQIYDGLGNKTSMKIGAENQGASFSGTLSADNFTIAGYSTLIDYLYPVGAVYMSITDTNPSTRFANTTWNQVAQGSFVVGVGLGTDENSNNKTFTASNNAGSYSKILTTANLPSHSHFIANDNVVVANSANALTSGNVLAVGGSASLDQAYMLKGSSTDATIGKTSSVGEATPVSITPPAFGVYVWQRTS